MKKYLLILGSIVFSFLNLNAQQTVPLKIHIDEDFDAQVLPTNWTNSAITGSFEWKFGLDGANAQGPPASEEGDPGDNNIDGTGMAIFDDDSLKNGNRNNTASLETASFDNTVETMTILEFDYNFRSAKSISPSITDSFYVDVYDGSNWNRVFSVDTNSCGQYASKGATFFRDCGVKDFPHEKIDISAFKNANCKVRFVYHDGNDWSFYAAVDNVVIYSPQEHDLSAGKVISPVTDCGLSASEIVQVTIYNTGANLATNFDVSLDINNGAQTITETYSDTIFAQESEIYSFLAPLDFSVAQVYDMSLATTLTADTLKSNDTNSTSIFNDTTYRAVYFDSFEGQESDWISSGDSMAWERGFPAGQVISSARGGNLAWVTTLAGAYPDNDNGSILTSPCFDFTGALGDPIISFDLFRHIDGIDDILFMQTSIDNGQTWQNVPRAQISINWYNNSKQDGWNGVSGGWIRVENVLAGLAGEGAVKVRFFWRSDSPSPVKRDFNGAAIDRLRIELPDSINLGLRKLNYPLPDFTPECGYAAEVVDIQIENRGATAVDSFIVAYQIDNNTIVKDTIFQALLPNRLMNYTFDQLGDFSESGGTYRFSVWVEAIADGTTSNDTVADIRIDNNSPGNRITPFKENFDGNGFTPGTVVNNNNSIINSDWTRSSTTTWEVANSGAFTTAGTGPNSNHTLGNPNGNFMYVETSEGDTGDVAILETPCINFAGKSSIRLEFWYYRFGGLMSSLVIDVFDGTRWVDSVSVISAQPQTSSIDLWTPHVVNLDAFAGKRIKIRFKGQKMDDNADGGDVGDIAIDDIILYEPTPNDVEFIDFVAPISDCNIGQNSDVIVQFYNFGTGTIPKDSLILTCVYYPKSDPFLADTLIDTIKFDINSKDTVAHVFTKKANIASDGSVYVFDAWSTLNADSNYGNDSIFDYEAANFSKLPGYVEKFESFDFIDGNCLNPFDDFLGRGWSISNSAYNWNIQNARTCIGPNGATPTLGTGPAGDHTTTEGKFMYIESNLGPGTAELISPCIDFSNASGAAVAFWYHMYGSQTGKLFIDVLADGVWNNAIDSIVGQQQVGIDDAWRVRGVNFGQFAGKKIQVRFRGESGAGILGDIAIDDIEFFEPIPQDARVSQVITPITECSPAGVVKIAVENFGEDTILPNRVQVNFRTNGGQIFSELLPVGIGVGDSVHYTFNSIGDFSQLNTVFTMLAWTELANDTNTFNDTLLYRFTNITQGTAYRENFESFRDGGCGVFDIGDLLTRGWESDPAQTETPFPAHWNVQNAAGCPGGTPQGGGPQSDGTSGRGNYMYMQTVGSTSNTASLYSPCIDFTNDTTAGMIFNYHKLGSGNSTLYIDILGDNGWVLGVDSITGRHQQFRSDPWREYAVKFEEFAGQEIQIRFRGVSPNSDVIAIDDVEFYFPQAKDARVNAVTAPIEGCELFENSVIAIEIENFGTTGIDSNSVTVYYQIENRTPVGELIIDSIGRDSTYEHVFAQTGDLSISGRAYNIKTWTSLTGEQNVSNDTLFTYVVFNETKRTNYFEDFESFKDAGCTNAIGQATDNGWVIYGTGDYSWNIQSSLCGKNDEVTITRGTGPDGDHTTGIGYFLYAESSTHEPTVDNPTAGTSYFESPCIDLAPNTKTFLSFWYHRFGTAGHLGPLSVEVLSNGVWSEVGTTITGSTQNTADENWTQQIIDLSDYIGERILIRFKISNGGGIRGDIAIDDIMLYEPSSTDVGVVNVIQPNVDGCVVGQRNVIAQVRNYGLSKINAGTIAMQYLIRGDIVRDTIQQDIDSGQTILFTFKKRVDLANYSGVQNLEVSAALINDTITENNSAFIEVVNRQPGFPRYFVDFENHSSGGGYGANDLQGWKRNVTPNLGPSVYGWHVSCGTAPWVDGETFYAPQVGPATGPSGDHTFADTYQNGRGCYLLVESDILPVPFILDDATIELPCGNIDFTKSKEGKILLSFWYHMFGAGMGNLFVDVNNGVQWFNGFGNGIRGAQQFDDTDRWQRFELSLDSFLLNDDMKIRLRAEFEDRGGDIAVDDLEILDRVKNDGRIDAILDPTSNCDLTNTERLRVRYQNVGTQDILEAIMAYQIIYTPAICLDQPVEIKPVVRDTVVGPLGFSSPLSYQEFEFEDRVDMSAPGSYEFKVWTEIGGDTNYFNDTLVETIVNSTRPFNCCEDFSDMTFGQTGKQFREGLFPNSWDGNTAGYAFKVSRRDGGPVAGHTGRNNDAYLFADDADGNPGDVARIESPCFDLTNATAAILEFWYQAPSTGHFLLIEAQAVGAGGWDIIDTLYGENLFGVQRWTKSTNVLSDYIGDFVRVRFRGVNAGNGYYAIDDVCIKQPPPQEIELERFVTPQRNLCFYSDRELVTLRLQNVGLDRITTFRIVLTVDSAFQNFPAGRYLRDTVTVVLNQNPFFDPGVKVDIALDLPDLYVDLLTNGLYWFNAYVLLDGDTDENNNLIEDYPINHVVPIELPYIEDFELVRNEGIQGFYSNGISNSPASPLFYHWSEENRLEQFRDGLTGPAVDHTKDSEKGTYMITNAQAGQLGDAAVLTTRCIDLRFAINPEMRYWYYMFGFRMGNLRLQINDDTGWRTIDSLFGQDPDQTGHRKQWKSRTIDLKDYAGSVVRLRYVSNRGRAFDSDMAIDDISVYDLAAKDISPVSLSKPTDDTLSCYTLNQELIVNLRNNGSQAIDFPVDTTIMTAIILKGEDVNNLVRVDSLYQMVVTNPLSGPLQRDSIAAIKFDSTFDMTDTGMIYRFIVDVKTKGDLINRNDRYLGDVKSQIVGGDATLSSNPDNRSTICSGDPVELLVKDFFGQVSWESRRIRPDGSGDWNPTLTTPRDKVTHIGLPDTTTQYRVRICGAELVSSDPNFAVYSDTFTVNVIKPSAPRAIDFSICGDSFPQRNDVPLRYGAIVQDFVDRVYAYDSTFQTRKNKENEVPPEGFFSFTQNFTAGDGVIDTLYSTLFGTKTDTAYLESVVEDNRVLTGVCYSRTKSRVISTINTPPVPLFTAGNDTICKDSAILLDGGKVPYAAPDEDGNTRFYRATYAWTIYMPDGTIYDTSSATPDTSILTNQTLVVDASLLDPKNTIQTYGYEVSITTDSCPTPISSGIRYISIVNDTIFGCITSIEEIAFRESFSIFPNPVADELFISHQSSDNFKGVIRLLSIEGQEIMVFDELGFGNLNQRIDMGVLPKGIYIIKVETEKGSFVEKVIKS